MNALKFTLIGVAVATALALGAKAQTVPTYSETVTTCGTRS